HFVAYFRPLDTWFDAHTYPTGDGISMYLRDVTARKRAEAGLAMLARAGETLGSPLDQRKRLAAVAELAVSHMADWCVIDLLLEGRLERVEVAHADAAQRPFAETLRRMTPRLDEASSVIARVVREGRPELLRFLDRAELERQGVTHEQLALIERLGLRSAVTVPLTSRGHVLGAMTLVVAESGRPYDEVDLQVASELGRICGVAIDNARLYEQANQAIRNREQLLAVVSHDLRNPLNAILLQAEALGRTTSAHLDPEGVKRRAESIARSGLRMNRLISDLLDYATMQSGSLKISPRPCDAIALLREIIDTHQSQAAASELELELLAPREPFSVRCDRDRVLQVLSNLVSNAIRATGRGGTVQLSVRGQGDDAVFTVSDTGSGISAEDQAMLFERFYRGSNAEYRGTGLGLAISRGIVEAHGGRIWVESRRGAGSRFSFTLPRVEVRAGDDAQA
ncbi:MAG: ATP-binding protein, partial [Myxococcales bacterium]